MSTIMAKTDIQTEVYIPEGNFGLANWKLKMKILQNLSDFIRNSAL